MRIAIVTQPAPLQPAYGNYLLQLITEAAKEAGYHISNASKHNGKSALPEHACIIIRNTSSSQIALKWFYEVTLPGILKKLQVQCVVHTSELLSVATAIPQLIVQPLPPEVQTKGSTGFYKYRQKHLAQFLNRASYTATFLMADAPQTSTGKMLFIPYAASPLFAAVTWEKKELLKAEYTGGSEYFLVKRNFNTEDDLLFLLKSFTVFKKWQHSSMKLVIAGAINTPQMLEKINTYKYRNDVKVVDNPGKEDYAALVASAYCFIHLPEDETDLLPVMEAMQAGTGVITSANTVFKNVLGELVLYNEESTTQSLGNNMVRIYQNEQLRNLNIMKSLAFTAQTNLQQVKTSLFSQLTSLT